MKVVRATSVDHLVAGLVRQLVDAPPADPLAPVDIAVPSRGMERWLVQRLAADLGAAGDEAGVCANVRFPFPGSVVRNILGAVLGDDTPAADPWAPQRLAWPLLELLEELPDDPVHGPLRAHLSDDGQYAQRRRFPLARRIADLFDRYAMYRPEMVARWAEGVDTLADGTPLGPNVAWQPPLWRALLNRTGEPSPDVRFRRAIAALGRDDVAKPDALPSSVTLFGVMALPDLHLELLAALGASAEVTLHAVTPCRRWAPGVPPSSVEHPLLDSCGRAARHAHAALVRHESTAGAATAAGSTAGASTAGDDGDRSTEAAGDGDGAAPTALAVLRDDIHHDRRRGPRDASPRRLAPSDDSVQVHACHGQMRQLEVLREVLLGLLEDDPTLEPRDIVVLTPDTEAFEPMITAVFSDGDRHVDRQVDRHVDQPEDGVIDGAAGASGVPALPFRIADRTLREENAVARALLDVLELVTARVGASAVIDLLATAPVSNRFGLSPADVAQLPSWALGTGISWGIDAEHRRQLIDLDDGAHTWAAGLDRLTLGAAMADDGTRMVGGVVPYDDVEGSDVELLGRLADATDVLFGHLRSLQGRRTVTAWREALEAAVDDLLDPGPGPRRDATTTWQLAAVREALGSMVTDSAGADGAPSAVELTLEEVRAVLGAHLGESAASAQYGSGAITFTGLVPLRNVPHRVVCLVGLDDGALPRSVHRHGFDLIATHPEDGDPDPRLEDRQLLLDAILSARDHCIVTYTGRDARTNEVRQPAVPVSELLDVLDEALYVDDRFVDGVGTEVRARLLTAHPLQPHSARYFRDPGDDEDVVPRSFDRRQLVSARAAVGERRPAPDFFPAAAPLPPPGSEVDADIVELSDLVRFLEHPVRHLLQRRLGISLGEDDPRLEDRDPTELNDLERWQVGEDLLTRTLAETPSARWRELTLACGNVPVGGLGEVALDGVEELVDALCGRVREVGGERRSIPIDLFVPVPGDPTGDGARRLIGSVETADATVLHVSVSTLKAKHRLGPWVRLLAATAAEPPAAEPISGRLLGRHKTKPYDEVVLQPLAATRADDDERTPGDLARDRLGELLALYLRGRAEPVPLLPETAREYALRLAEGKGHAAAMDKAADKWKSGFRPGEQADVYVAQAFGRDCELATLAERFPFAQHAEQLWTPILTAEGK